VTSDPWEVRVAGWPNLDRLADRRQALALRAGDIDAMAHIYDGYADRLYDYCHALLRDQRAAAGALHDAFVAAQMHIGRLQDPERFRGWLYALVRNECLRRLYDPARPDERQEAPEVEDPFLDLDERARRDEARQLLHSALSGLNGRQRETVDLELRHQLDVQELGGVLGLPQEQAAELADQAKAALDDALAAAIIARSGRGECPSVAALVDTWEWPLTPAVCKKLVRHIETCPVCGERRRRKISTARLLQALPVAALPPDLRQHLFLTASAADMNAARTEIAQRAEPFNEWGWPVSLDRNLQPSAGRGRASRLWPALAAAACVLLVVGAVFLYLPRSSDKPDGSPAQGAIVGTEDSSSASVSPSEETSVSETPSPTETPTSAPPTTRTPTRTTRPPSTRPPTRQPTTRPPSPEPTTVSVAGCTAGPPGFCSVSITANGGTVSWTAAASRHISLSDTSGTVRDGETDSIRATVDVDDACDDGQDSGAVVFTPGGSAPVSWSCD
jgi:RNA polymerase sigma factor (sigma-70 family)